MALNKTVKCPMCGADIPVGNRFCQECGTEWQKMNIRKSEVKDPAPVTVPGMMAQGICSTDQINEEKPPKGPSDEGLKMIVDYCRKTLATAVGDGHDETVLYLDEKTGQYQIHRYVMDPGEQGERHVGFETSSDAYDAVMKHIKKARLASYEGKRADALCGGEVVVKFLKDDKMIRISTSNVPYEHHSDLDMVGRILGSFIDKEKELH